MSAGSLAHSKAPTSQWLGEAFWDSGKWCYQPHDPVIKERKTKNSAHIKVNGRNRI